MKALLAVFVVVALGVVLVAEAQQVPQPGSGPMGPGMMMGMHQQMLGMMQQMGGMMQHMGEMMKQMGSMMGGMASMGGGQMGSMSMPEMSKMMERMAEMQKRMSEAWASQRRSERAGRAGAGPRPGRDRMPSEAPVRSTPAESEVTSDGGDA